MHRGIALKGPDGLTRICHPILAAFSVDYPEACQITLVRPMYSCPICIAGKHDFGTITKTHEERTVASMKLVYDKATALYTQSKQASEFIDPIKYRSLTNEEIAKSMLQDVGLIGLYVSFDIL